MSAVLDGGAGGVEGLRAVARRVQSWRWPGWLVVGSAALLGLGLRLLGIRLGLPFLHHWDEIWVVDSAKKMLQTEDWEPSTYQYGAPLSEITAWIWVTISQLWPKVHFYDPSDGITMRLIGRIVTAVISSAGAGGVYLAARYATPGDDAGRVRGAYAAILYATAAELVSHGRYAVTDADLVAWVAWSLGACALFLRTGGFGWAVATLLFAAMAVSFKVTAATALAIPAFAFMLRAVTVPGLRAPAWGRGAMLAAIPLAAAFFLLMNPHVAIHWQNALRDIQSRSRQTIEGGFPEFMLRKPGLDHLSSVLQGIALLAFHRWVVPAVVAAAAAVFGLALALRQRCAACAVGIGHAVIAILAIALTSRAYLFRNYLVTIPILCVGFGFTMQAATAAVASWARRGGEIAQPAWPRRILGRVPWLAAAFAIVYVAVPIGQAVRAQRLSLDARARALDWISAQAGTHRVTVACSPDIISQGGYKSDWLRDMLKRPGIRLVSDVKDADDAARSHADYILIVSHYDKYGDWGDVWPFTRVKGYESAGHFDASTYEHRWEITATWDGRFNVILLKRAESHGA